MKLYSELPARRARQLFADVFAAVWVIVWVRVGLALHHAVAALATPGERIADAGSGLERNLRSAGDSVDSVPLIGRGARSAFDQAGASAAALRDAGHAQVDAINSLATFLGVAIAVIPIILLLLGWLPRRVRFARRARQARALRDSPNGLELFALRALTTQPISKLTAIHPAPATAWRADDPIVIESLAALELRNLGLRAGPSISPR